MYVLDFQYENKYNTNWKYYTKLILVLLFSHLNISYESVHTVAYVKKSVVLPVVSGLPKPLEFKEHKH